MKIHLRTDFVPQPRADRAIEKVAQTGADRTFGKVAGRVNEPGKLVRRQGAPSATDDEMKADVKVGIFARQGGRFVARRSRDHQTGRGEAALAMSTDDAGVDLARIAKVVG